MSPFKTKLEVVGKMGLKFSDSVDLIPIELLVSLKAENMYMTIEFQRQR